MKDRPGKVGYVLVTPAKDEEACIEKTILGVLGQTVRPARWVIVNDGSSDSTRKIVEQYCARHDFIRLINRERVGGRDFGSKALAFREGLGHLDEVTFDYIGNLDADIVLPANYYETILGIMEGDPQIGIAGGCIGCLENHRFVSDDLTLDSVGGAVQLFRLACYRETGGYKPMTYGGIDAAAEVTAKARGWTVRKVLDLQVVQQRDTGLVGLSWYQSKLRNGRRFHSLGYGLGFYLFRCLFRVAEKPFLFASLVSLSGYLDSMIRRRPVLIDPAAVRYWRGEHYRRFLGPLQRGCSRGLPAHAERARSETHTGNAGLGRTAE